MLSHDTNSSDQEEYGRKIRKSVEERSKRAHFGIQSLLDELRTKQPKCGNEEAKGITSTSLIDTQKNINQDLGSFKKSYPKLPNIVGTNLKKNLFSMKQKFEIWNVPCKNEEVSSSLITSAKIGNLDSAPPLKSIDSNSIKILSYSKGTLRNSTSKSKPGCEIRPMHNKRARKNITDAIRRGDLSLVNETQIKTIDRNKFSFDESFISISSFIPSSQKKPTPINDMIKISSKQKSKHQINVLVRNAACLEAERTRMNKFGFNRQKSCRIDAKRKYGW